MSGSGTLMNWCTNTTMAFRKLASAGEKMPFSTSAATGPGGYMLTSTSWRSRSAGKLSRAYREAMMTGFSPPKVTVYLRVTSMPFRAMILLMLAWKWLIVPRGKPIMSLFSLVSSLRECSIAMLPAACTSRHTFS